MISLYFIGGIIIYNLGIIGIYLGKTFNETKKRPLYIIRNSTFSLSTSSPLSPTQKQMPGMTNGQYRIIRND